jgi:hypothetical protein
MDKKKIVKEDIQKLYDSGLSQADIASQYGVVAATIHRKMRQFGIIARSIKEAATLISRSDINDPLKMCSTCKEVKEKSINFDIKSSVLDGYCSQCKKCVSKMSVKVRAKRKQRVLSKEQIIKEKLNRLFFSVRSRAVKRKLLFTIDFVWLVEQFIKQNGCCRLTNIKLEFPEIGSPKNPYSPSIDQIIPGKGYSKENSRLVCTAINLGMNEFGTETFKLVAEAFIRNEKEEKEKAQT